MNWFVCNAPSGLFGQALTRHPALLREQLEILTPEELSSPVILDEVQKVPHLLDEVHWLIENKGVRFILCGSSARKLRRGHANLLGGRAWHLRLYPLTTCELPDLNLLRALNNGLIPTHYLNAHGQRSYRELEYNLAFWRTKSGMEVDFILGDGQVAVEVKGSRNVHSRDLRPLRAFVEEYSPQKAFIVCNEQSRPLKRHT